MARYYNIFARYLVPLIAAAYAVANVFNKFKVA